MMNGTPALGVIINGAGGVAGPPTVDLEDLEPQPRDRCNTWPLQKPAGDLAHHTSPLIHEEIPEEEIIDDEDEGNDGGSGDTLNGAGASFDAGLFAATAAAAGGNNNSKKNSARRNAWGNLSYADLITQAILNSSEKRLTLSQIYDWMVQNVPYFRDKGDSNSSAGWKNSIRHNLSLHSRFMRIQNEGAGKSSWWVINPEAKPGKSSRRRAGSMEQSAKNCLEKKRGRVKKKLMDQMMMINGGGGSVDGTGAGGSGLLSPNGGDDPYEASSTMNGLSAGFCLSPGEFRTRSDSNLSNYSVSSGGAGHNRLSPRLEEAGGTGSFDDWAQAPSDDMSVYPDLVDSLAPMNLGSDGQHFVRDQRPPPPPPYGANESSPPMFHHYQPQHSPNTNNVSPQRRTPVKTSPQHPMFSIGGMRQVKVEPPAYRDLYPAAACRTVRAPPSTSDNPMLRDVLQRGVQQQPQQHFFNNYNYNQFNGGGGGGGNQTANGGQLAPELQEIHLDNPDFQCDIDQVIRHELNVAGKLEFTTDFGNF